MFAITIDGPAAAGKTTTAALLAENLGLLHLDSGAIFRTITLYCLRNGIHLKDEDQVSAALKDITINFKNDSIFLNGEKVTKEIRKPEISRQVQYISHLSPVRAFTTAYQKNAANHNRVIIDGRKTGTEVFPDATIKFFLTARREIRTGRRYNQFIEAGTPATYSEVAIDIKKRDDNDIDRGILITPPDAIIIDNSYLNILETFLKLRNIIIEKSI